MPFHVRDIDAQDIPSLPGVFRAAICDIACRHYTQEQLNVWLARTPSETDFEKAFADGRHGFVLIDEEDRIVGFADVRPNGHIHWFYCHPCVSGTGQAGALYGALEDRARSLGMHKMSVDASETARGFFRRQGFVQQSRNDLTLSGVAIHNYTMTKEPL